jgi:signal transduction histidine kinase
MKSTRSEQAMPVKNRKLFRMKYQASIWLYTGLLAAVLITLGLGTVFNFHQTVKLWEENQIVSFRNLTETMAILLDVYLKGHIVYGEFSREQHRQIQTIFRKYKLDLQYRLYLVTRKSTYLIFPERTGEGDGVRVSRGPVEWQEGWQGIHKVTSPYAANNGRQVIACVQPLPASERTPEYLVILEKDLTFKTSLMILVHRFDTFFIAGFACTVVILILYAGTMIRPFRDLGSIVVRYGEESPVDSDGPSDPVQASISLFKQTLSNLKHKETQLEKMNLLLEKQSQKSEELKENILSSVDSGVMTFDRKYKLLSVTSKIGAILQMELSDPTGRTCEEIFGVGSIFQSMLRDAVARGTVFQNRQWKWQIPGEQSRWLSLTSHLLKGDFDDVTGVGFIVRDITAWKQLEEQIRAKEHLAVLGELSAGIAHEIRNPLGVINGNADLLAQEAISPEDLDLVKEIKHEVQTLDRIIQDFLKFARPTTLEISQVDISKFLQEILDHYRDQYSPRIQFTFTGLIQNVTINIDEILFRQVMVNLLDNAVQAIVDSGTISLDIKSGEDTGTKQKPSRYVSISIRDTGAGISPSDFNDLFKPFFTTRAEGTGLGLAISQKLVLLHNGYIEFDPNVTDGSLVTITLPVAYDPDSTLIIRKT